MYINPMNREGRSSDCPLVHCTELVDHYPPKYFVHPFLCPHRGRRPLQRPPPHPRRHLQCPSIGHSSPSLCPHPPHLSSP